MNEDIENILHREGITLADKGKRATAFFIDEILLSLLLLIALWESFVQTTTTEEVIMLTNSVVLEYMALKIIYQAFFVMQYGASIGKIIMKIKVIEIRTLQNPNVLVALNRAVFRVVSEMFFYLGFIWGLMNPSRQTWHDKTAKTLVVNV
ncbi:MAG: RDD family protein [Helicobacteraceae bacterium]|nr:RDD family protein [Candidatus Sulfurimonas ponti]